MIRPVLVLLAAFTIAAISGCQGGGGYQARYFDSYGEYCGSRPYAGCTYTEYGNKIRYWDDPYNYMVQLDFTRGYCDSWGFCTQTWYSPTGVWYDMNGYAINARGDRGRDMAGDLSELEKEGLGRTAGLIASRYGLAEAQALDLVQTVSSFERLTQGRGRTAQDLENVSQRLLGKSFQEAAEAFGALETGDAAPIRALERDVAEFWGTDPETVRELLTDWYRSGVASE